MTLFVDTSVWSLALRRDRPGDLPEVERLANALRGGETVVTTGLVLQELLQGFHGARDAAVIQERFAVLPLIVPDRSDHIAAATLRTTCRRDGLQIGTIDALLASLCLRHDLELLTADRDFERIAERHSLRLWRAGA